MERRYYILLNARAGSVAKSGITPESLRELCALKGHLVTVDADTDTPFMQRVDRAMASDAEVIVAAGGDGTVSAIANAIAGTCKTLGILPLGTANLLARDLGVPLDLTQATAALGTLEPRRIDVGRVNGRTFLLNVTIGLVPGMAAKRERMRGRNTLGAKLGFLRDFFRRLSQARRLAVEIAQSPVPRGSSVCRHWSSLTTITTRALDACSIGSGLTAASSPSTS